VAEAPHAVTRAVRQSSRCDSHQACGRAAEIKQLMIGPARGLRLSSALP
jgi:hypothetical protein